MWNCSEGSHYLVSISYSSKDRWIAEQMANLIEGKGREYGVETFRYEKDIEGGEQIAEKIRQKIEECGEFLVLFSQASIDRPWVLIETGAAFGLRKFIVAIIEKVAPDEMPDILIPYKAIDLNDFEEYLEQLIKRAKEAKNECDSKRKE